MMSTSTGSQRRSRHPRRIATAAALAFALAACGSGDTGSDAVETGTAAPVTTGAPDQPDDVAPTTATPTTNAAGDADATSAPTTAAPTADDAPAPTSTDAVVVPDALQFSAPLVGGGTFDGAAVAGIPTAFWFWAPT